MLRVPGSTQRAGADNAGCDGAVCGAHVAVYDVHAVFVGECCVCAFPGGYAAAAAAEEDVGGLDPGCAEAVEEVGLAREDGFVEVGVAEFADVDLVKGGLGLIDLG